MKALVFGHSQSGGMGLDLVAALKKREWQVVRSTHNGFSDYKLLNFIPDLGDLSQIDRTYLFAGANNPHPTPETILKMVKLLGGAERVTVILPPYNEAKESPTVMADQTTKGWVNSQALKAAGVPVYRVLAPAKEFSDGIHLRRGSATSKELAEQIVGGQSQIGQAVTGAVGVGAVVGVAFLLWFVFRGLR